MVRRTSPGWSSFRYFEDMWESLGKEYETSREINHIASRFENYLVSKLQLLTAVGGAVGACTALFLHMEFAANRASQNILPFTAGGFINIALAQILPELMSETDTRYQSIITIDQRTVFVIHLFFIDNSVKRTYILTRKPLYTPKAIIFWTIIDASDSYFHSLNCLYYSLSHLAQFQAKYFAMDLFRDWHYIDGSTESNPSRLELSTVLFSRSSTRLVSLKSLRSVYSDKHVIVVFSS